ncbi:NIPSNAP family protein [Microbaculum marinum]|uniref:NIPSNAP family protein n=1 Tax=Microbaculum marinum TaxID=1764581 RepID=A0AAW9RRZ9_9HYPH
MAVADPSGCAVVELRQYTLHPGQRDVLIDLFDREFVESQDAVGMTVMGQFRDLERDDRFVWLRGFPGMEQRASSLAAFYGGPVWAAHRDDANATMIDFDDVLLLRPARSGAGLAIDIGDRPGRAAGTPAAAVFAVDIHPIARDAAEARVSVFFEKAVPILEATGAEPAGVYVSEPGPNTFPALPVRETDTVLVWVARFADQAAFDDHAARLSAHPGWAAVAADLGEGGRGEPLRLILSPTARSAMR